MEKVKNRKPLDLLLFFILGIGVGIAFGMSSALLIQQGSRNNKKEYRYETFSLDSCKDAKVYYPMDDKDVYLYCLNSIKIHDGGNLLELKNYLQNHPNEIENMIAEMEIVGQFEDGGSILYRDNGKLSKNGFAILKCATLTGSKDIYIGPKDMEFKKDFCPVKEELMNPSNNT